MKKTLFITLLCAAIVACCVEIDVNGRLEVADGSAVPHHWMRNGWSGYNPPCTLTVVKDGGKDGNSLKMSDIRSENGAAFNSTFQAGRSGDTVRVLFRARGKGKGKVQMFFKTVTDEWNFISPVEIPFMLSESWRDFSANLPVLNGKAGETGSFDLCFQMSTGGELEISDIHVDVETGKYRGDLPFCDTWTVFGPFPEAFMPNEAVLTAVPETIEGKSGRLFVRRNNTLDLADMLTVERQSAWLFATLDAPYDCDYAIGGGADWWMCCYLNGKAVIDTTAAGNVDYPYSIHNHEANVRLKKGLNVLAVRMIRGKGSALLKLGGPKELADRTLALKPSKLVWIEDFNGKDVTCSGKPELITGYPAPGLLSPTGQGVFKTNGTVRIAPPVEAMQIAEDKDIFRTIGLRIQNFGEKETAATAALVFQDGTQECRLAVINVPDSADLTCQVLENGSVLTSRSCPKSALPADILFGGDCLGRYAVTITSLSGGANLSFAGDCTLFSSHPTLQTHVELMGQGAEMTADNFCQMYAKEKTAHSTVPFMVKPAAEFDPVKAGWKLVFDDEFDGTDIDWNKWERAWAHTDGYYTVKDGILTIKCDWTDDTHKKLAASSIKTRDSYLYGYFEWRGRFKRQSGWWSAFWLYGRQNSNPFYDGFEIDIYEDYYLASMEKDKPARNVLDHNLHINMANTLKSWNYNSPQLADPDAYTTIGCKWTPFEISYYMNGKLIRSHATHSPYDSVTFDPFNHSCGITPLQAIVSSQVNRKSGGPTELGTFPDFFYTDYVRIYEYPHSNPPQVRWTVQPPASQVFSNVGDTLSFAVEASPNQRTGSKIQHVYLFDSGFLLDYKSKPPYTFDVRLTKEYFDATDYVRPGRQNIVPDFRKGLHSFVVYVQDEQGNVSHTDAWTLMNIAESQTGRNSRPYQGQAARIPGVIEMMRFDEGGEGCAYHDTQPKNQFPGAGAVRTDEDVDGTAASIGYIQNGEWLNYTVDIAEAGTYTVDFTYGSPYTKPGKTYLMLDGFNPIGVFTVQCPPNAPQNWTCDKHARIDVTLPQGRHVIRIYFVDGLNAAKLEFTRK